MATRLIQLVSFILVIHAEFLHAQRFMRGCVFESSSRLRTNDAAFTVRDIDFTLCTHYIYASAKVYINGLTVVPANRSDEEGPTGLYKQFNDGKKKLRGTKTILSVGGEAVANDVAFEYLKKKDATFQSFSQNAVKYVKDQGFDGINIHWETGIDNSGKKVLPKLLQALRKVINQDVSPKLLLTMTGCAAGVYIRTKYDVPELNKVVDYVFVNSRYLITLNTASFIAPLYYKHGYPGAINNLNNSIHFWQEETMPYNKLVIGVIALGNYVQLKDPSSFYPGERTTSTVLRGPRYNIDNRLAYPEICTLMGESVRYFDTVQKSAYLVHEGEWIGYIDNVSLYERIQFMKAYDLAGIYFMNLDEDDFSGTACKAGKFPLVTYLRDKLDPVRPTVAPPETTTVMIDTTYETQRDNNIDLTTTTAVNGENAPTTTTITEQGEKKEGSISVLGYIMFIFVFIVGHIFGLLFMRMARHTYDRYK